MFVVAAAHELVMRLFVLVRLDSINIKVNGHGQFFATLTGQVYACVYIRAEKLVFMPPVFYFVPWESSL